MKGLYMAIPLIVGGVMAGASLLGGLSGNAQARQQYETQIANIKTSLNKQWAQLQEQARREGDNTAMEMATARFEGLKGTATTGNTLVDRELTGNTAARVYNQSLVNRTMAHNALAKKAEDAMVSFGSAMEAKRDEAIQAIYGASAQLSANTKSTLAIATDAIKAGAQGYAMGSMFSGAPAATGATGATGANNIVNAQTLTTQSVLPSGGGVFVNPNSLTATSFYSGGF